MTHLLPFRLASFAGLERAFLPNVLALIAKRTADNDYPKWKIIVSGRDNQHICKPLKWRQLSYASL